MDTLTHALLGALVVRAAAPRGSMNDGVDTRTRTLAGGLVAAFPDIDYLSFWIAPLTFLAEWHRGPTHSLVLTPVWALLLGVFLAVVWRNPRNWRVFVGISALALLSHIASDVITAYGTQILSPISDYRAAFGTTFVVDPYFSAIIVLALAASMVYWPHMCSRIGLSVLVGYVGFQLVLQQQAKALGEAYISAEGLAPASVSPLPQPLSPFNWLIIVTQGQRYHVARVNLAAQDEGPAPNGEQIWIERLWFAYRPRNALIWQVSERYGDDTNWRHLAEKVWQLETFAQFRRFARLPFLYRIDDHQPEVCVWYTDLRYVLPVLTPPFRYGMCGSGNMDTWGLFRLRRFSYDDRQYLGGDG